MTEEKTATKVNGKRFDISTRDTVAGSNVGFEMELYDPDTSADTGIKIMILGRDSDVYRKTQRKQQQRRLNKMQKSGVIKFGSLSPEEVDEDMIELMAVCTKSWSGLDEKGKELPCTFDNAVYVYTKYPWIREQVSEEIGNRANFTKS